MGMNVGGKKGQMADINITPYIDILLVLLIIFMVITPIRQMDLDVKVPQTSNESGAPDPSVIVVSVGLAGQLEINQEPTNIGDLGSKLRDIYSKRANKNMFIMADAKLAYGDVVHIIDIAKGAGVQDIGLLTSKIQ